MATLYQEIFELIRGKCVSDESAKMAAKDVAKLVETKFTSYNKQSTPYQTTCSHYRRVYGDNYCSQCGMRLS
jgi:hypothetical protein